MKQPVLGRNYCVRTFGQTNPAKPLSVNVCLEWIWGRAYRPKSSALIPFYSDYSTMENQHYLQTDTDELKRIKILATYSAAMPHEGGQIDERDSTWCGEVREHQDPNQ